jgi:tRNA U34 5-carboxymethylaminomethyl modifying enzyme MnmG/GidA
VATNPYHVIVIGAGHAGCEAARACARLGLRTAMVTMNLDLIAQMSCNPAVGGIAKGHLVREIDALGGVMGEVTDAVGIQFRLLNTSRGPAVWSPRAQCDKKQYRLRMRQVLEAEPNLRIIQAEAARLIISGGRARGIETRDHGNLPQRLGSHRRTAIQLQADPLVRGVVALLSALEQPDRRTRLHRLSRMGMSCAQRNVSLGLGF